MSEQYPCHYSTTALVSLMAAIESVVFAFFREKDWNQWKLGFNIRLLTVAYAVCSIISLQYYSAPSFIYSLVMQCLILCCRELFLLVC